MLTYGYEQENHDEQKDRIGNHAMEEMDESNGKEIGFKIPERCQRPVGRVMHNFGHKASAHIGPGRIV